MKKFFVFALLFSAFFVSAQSALKPIPQMVADARSTGLLPEMSLFAKSATPASAIAELNQALPNGLVLEWDAALCDEIRAKEGQPLTLMLPFENNGTLSLELAPAKNFSPDFQVHLAHTGEAVTNVDKGVHYWGIVKGDVNSLVTISVYENEVMGLIATEEDRFAIGKIEGRQDKKHILFRESQLGYAENFTCFTDDELHRIGEKEMEAESRSVGPDNCVRMFVETDFTLFQNKGSVANVTTYMTGVFSQVSALYTNESVNVVLHDLFVWSVADPYTGPSASNYLTQFRNAKNGVYNGDLAHLVGIHNLGGVAYLDVLCNAYYGVGYSSINATYSNVPTYSWTIEVLTHEIGHNLGSPHTHACSWNGNGTALDGCGPTAGYSEGCTAPLPTNGGTVMSYCHLVSGVGINFNNGFGPQPGTLIRNEVYNAPCLAPCGGGGGCSYVAVNSNGFDSNWGIWTDGGTDCARINNATYAKSPTFSIQLRDNTNTSVMSTTSQNWTTYDEITVTFSYISVSFENGEDFWVQISTNGGSTYTTRATYVAGTNFTNGVRGSGTVVIPGPFTSTTRLRFRADASADDDQVYIDDVVITGCQQQFGAQAPERNAFGNTQEEKVDISNWSTHPNPAQDLFHIRFEAELNTTAILTITDLTGRVVLQNKVQAAAGMNHVTIPVAEWANGVYAVRLQAGETVLTERLLIAR